jgi:hypothetical protein
VERRQRGRGEEWSEDRAEDCLQKKKTTVYSIEIQKSFCGCYYSLYNRVRPFLRDLLGPFGVLYSFGFFLFLVPFDFFLLENHMKIVILQMSPKRSLRRYLILSILSFFRCCLICFLNFLFCFDFILFLNILRLLSFKNHLREN